MQKKYGIKNKSQIPQSDLKKKLDFKLKERNLHKNYQISETGVYNNDYIIGILGKTTYWIICFILGIFVLANTLLENNFSQKVVSKTTINIDGTKDLDTSWENFKKIVSQIREKENYLNE